MREILTEIQNGSFAREWVAEHAAGKPRFNDYTEAAREHEIEAVGSELRSLMPWLTPKSHLKQDDDLKFRVC